MRVPVRVEVIGVAREVGCASVYRGDHHPAGVVERTLGPGLRTGLYERSAALGQGRKQARGIYRIVGAGGTADHAGNSVNGTKQEHRPLAGLRPNFFRCPQAIVSIGYTRRRKEPETDFASQVG